MTELSAVRDRYQASRPVAAVLLLDNYEDLMKNLTENQRSTIYSEINARLDAWVDGTGGMLRPDGAGPVPLPLLGAVPLPVRGSEI